MRINLTPEQWDSFSRERMDDDDSGLQKCCANISALRDVITRIQRNNGDAYGALLEDLAEKWEWCRKGHSFDDQRYPQWGNLRSLIEQAKLHWPEGAGK